MPNAGGNGIVVADSKKKKRFSTNFFITFSPKNPPYFSDRFSHRFSSKTQQLKNNVKPARNDSQKTVFPLTATVSPIYFSSRFSTHYPSPRLLQVTLGVGTFAHPFLQPFLQPFPHQILFFFFFAESPRDFD